MLIGHLHIFFCKAYVENVCSFLIGLVNILFRIWKYSLCILERTSLWKTLTECFFTVYGLVFFSLNGFIQRAGMFNFDKVQFLISFYFMNLAFNV